MYGDPSFVSNPDASGNGTVIITSTVPCTGTPTAGTAAATPRNCPSEPFTLSLSGATMGGGLTYQWQRSDTGANNFSDMTGATSSSYTVTNQTVASDYRCIITCTNSNSTDTSNVVSVSHGVITANFSEDFDSTPIGTGSKAGANWPSCWSYIDSVTTGYGYVMTSNPQSSPNVYRMYRTNAVAGVNQELVLVSPETDNLGNGTKQLRFSVRSYITTNYINQLEILSMPDNTSTTGATVIATVHTTNANQTWQEFIVPLPATTDDYFGFRLAYNGTTTASSVTIDDIYYEDLSPCMYPMNIDVTNITETTATISWDAPLATGVTGYEYEIRTSGDPGSGTTGLEANGSVTGTTENVTGLTGATEYVVYVRSVCGTSQGIWTTFPANFMTDCPVYTDFSQNFDTTPVGTGSKAGSNYPHCWNYIDSTTTGYGYVMTSNPQSSPNVYRMYRTNTASGASSEELVLVSPPTDSLGNGTKQLRFSVRSYITTNYISQLEILSMPDNTSTAGATVIATINTTNADQTWQEVIVPFPATTDNYFSFRLAYPGVTTASSVTIDDIYYEDIPAPTIEDIIIVDNACFIDTSGSATVVIGGGVPPLTYEWLPSVSTSDTATDLAAGIYTVTVTDALNRSVTDTITISEPDELLSNITYDNISCNGNADGSATINPLLHTLFYGQREIQKMPCPI